MGNFITNMIKFVELNALLIKRLIIIYAEKIVQHLLTINMKMKMEYVLKNVKIQRQDIFIIIKILVINVNISAIYI